MTGHLDRGKKYRITIPVSITSLATASPYTIYSRKNPTYLKFFPLRRYYVKVYYVYQTYRSRQTDQDKQGKSLERKSIQERIRKIGETET